MYAVTLTLPEDVLTSRAPVAVVPALYAHLRPAMEAVAERIQARTEHPHIREGYLLRDNLAATSVSIELDNSDPNWIWREVDTAPHDIHEPAHYVPIADLIEWVESKGEPQAAAYPLQQWLATHDYTVHHPGTKGDHIVETEWEAAKSTFDDAFRMAVSDLLAVRPL